MKMVDLDNGLKTLFEHRPGTGVVAIQVWVKVGSKYEEEQIAGMTHFIEHLIFKGTAEGKGYEIAPRIEALGGSINAFTSYDNTVYHIIVPEHAFETGLELLVGSVKSPLFPEKEIAKEKKVVIQEIKMGEDNPQRKLFKELFSLSYEGHPYGRPIIGFEETVSAADRNAITRYFEAHYTIDNMVVVIVGDFDEARAKALLEKHFAGFRRGQGKTLVTGTPLRKGTGKVTRIEKDVKESYLALAYSVPPLVHHDIPALDVLAKMLGDGESSRLQAVLKHKKGLVTNAGTYLFTPKEEGLFIVLVTFKGDDYQAVVRAIDEQIKKMYTGPVDKWELEKAKNLVRASHIYASETVQGRAREIGSYQTITDDARFSDKYVKQVDSVSVPIIKQALKQYMVDKERNIALLAPKAKQNPHTFQLKNGLTCVLNRNAASPSFAFMIGFVGGLKEERESQNGSFNLLSKMLLRGTSGKDAQAIARQIDTLAGSMDPVSGKNVFGLSGKFLSKDLKQSLSLLNELLSDSTIPRRELTKVKEDVLSEIRQKEDDAVSSTFKAMNRALYEGHPYGRDALGNATDVARLTHKEIAALYKDCVSPKGAVLALSGDIDLKETERLVRSIFGAWKGKARSLRKLPHVATKKEKTIRREMLQTHMIFAFSGPGLIEEDRYAAEVMDSVLSGMGGRIHKRLREERPYAYALTFFNQMAYETGALGIYIGTEQKHVRDIEDVVGKEIGEIRKEGFSEEEVTNAKRYLVGTHRIRMQSNSAIASSMCLDTMYGLKPDFFKRWPERIEKVTRDEVNAAAKKYLLPEKMVEITVGPGDKK